MKTWPTKSLGDLVRLEYGKALKGEKRAVNGRYPVYGSNGIVGSYHEAVVREPTIIVGRKGAIGETHFAENGCWPIDTAFYTVLQHPGIVSLRYLLHWFRSVDLKSLAITVTIPGLNRNTLYAKQVPIPPLAIQDRIVKLLDEADELRKLRAQSDRRIAEFVPALFHEMFGDIITNPMQWPTLALGDLVKFVGGGTPSRARQEFFEGRIPWATSKDVKTDYMGDTQEHVTEEAVANSATNIVPAGSVLVVVKSKILMHSLPLAITTAPMCFGQDLKGLICGNKILPEFIVSSLSAQKSAILVQARGANTEGLTLEILRAVKIPLPPLSLQQEFAHRVTTIREMSAKQAASSSRLEELFQSLLHRAFKGDL